MLDLVTSIMNARSEAGRRGTILTICPSSNSATCTTGGSPEWNRGWITFLDDNGNQTVDTGEQVIQTFVSQHSNFSLTGSGGVANGISFRGGGSAVATGTMKYCDAGGSRALVINLMGHVAVETTEGGCS